MKTTCSFLRAAVCVPIFLVGSSGWAQQGYNPMGAAVNPLAPAGSSTESSPPSAAPNPEFGDLPDGEGAEETYYQCIACHSTAIIRQQHLSDARWDYLWTWMVKEQGMYEPDDETKSTILAYLKTHFSSER